MADIPSRDWPDILRVLANLPKGTDQVKCANVYAGTTGLDEPAALAVKAGKKGLDIPEAMVKITGAPKGSDHNVSGKKVTG